MAILVILTIQKMRLRTPKMRLFWVWHINGHKYDQRKAKNRNVSPPGRFCGQLAEPFYWFQFYPMLKVFLLSNWAHILRGWIFLRPGFHETLFEAVEAVWNSEVTRGCLRPSKSEVKIDILRPGEVIWVSYMGSEAARGHPWSRTFSLLDPHIWYSNDFP